MAEPAHQFDDTDLIPPEFTIDDEPFTDDDLDRFIASAVQLADEVGIDVEAAMEMMLGEEIDGPDVVPEGVRSFYDSVASGEVDIERMEWAMSKVRWIKATLANKEHHHANMIDRMTRFIAKARADAGHAALYYENYLKSQLRRAHELDDKVKSIPLASGKVTSTGPAKGKEYEAVIPGVEDAEDHLIVWAKANLEGDELAAVVQVKEKAMISELRKLVIVREVDGQHVVTLAATGMPVPQLGVKRKERTYDVKPDPVALP